MGEEGTFQIRGEDDGGPGKEGSAGGGVGMISELGVRYTVRRV